MDAKRNIQISMIIGILALLSVRVEPAAAVAGLADWEEHLAGPYYLSRGPAMRGPTRNVVSVVKKQGGLSLSVVEDIAHDRCHIHDDVIIGMTTEGEGFLIDIQSGEILVAGEADVKRQARSLGVPSRVCEKVFGWRLRMRHLFLGLGLGLAFSMLVILILRRIKGNRGR